LKREQILSLIAEIDDLLNALNMVVEEIEEKKREFSDKEPDQFILRALGSLLHDFYTIIEDIFELISSEMNGVRLDSFDWHKRLLNKMTLEIPGLRPAVISRRLKEMLDEYLRFRHVFRNVYGYLLQWERMKPLLEKAGAVYERFEEEIERFKDFLRELAEKM